MEMINPNLVLLLLSLSGICFVTGQGNDKCTRLIDVIAVVDGSDSLTPDDFTSLKTSLVTFAEYLDLGNGSQRFGVVVFSSDVSDTAPLSSNFATLETQISAFKHPADGTHTHTGIKKMTKMFENSRVGRKGVPMVGIVITDGRSKNQSVTLAAAKEAKDFGINMVAVGVGSKLNQIELHGIASRPTDVKQINTFNELQALVPTLVKTECPVPGNWSEWGPPTEGTCSETCGTGAKTLSYKRTCTNPAPMHGGRYCKGLPMKTETEACEMEQCVNPCSGCRYNNGVGYMPHPSDCRYFLQCVNYGASYFEMPCAPGLYWEQTHLTCTRNQDGCKGQTLAAIEPPPPPPPLAVTTPSWPACNERMRPVSSSNNQYEEDIPGHGWMTRHCPGGTIYNTTICTCVHGGTVVQPVVCEAELYLPFNGGKVKDRSRHPVHVLNVNGVKMRANQASFGHTSFLRVNYFSNFHFGNTLLIDFLMSKGPNTVRNQALVSNAECEAGSIYIIMRTDNKVEFRVVEAAGQTRTLVVQHTVPSSGLFRVKLQIDGEMMVGEVNNRSAHTAFKGDIARSHCALQIGKGTGFDSFRGIIDEFKLYLCIP